MAVELRTDSPLCRRIAAAFLDFLRFVEPAPGVDGEGLEVAKDCLEEAFNLGTSPESSDIPQGLLLELFRSIDFSKQEKLEQDSTENPNCTESSSSSLQFENSNNGQTTKFEGQAEDQSHLGLLSRDELFVRFYAALDKINFFITPPGGLEDPVQLAKATCLFDNAYEEMINSHNQTHSLGNLAETFKLRGNELMQSKLYSEAIELYTCAIAIQDKNAVYYCNRAAAYTQLQRYAEAIEDCLKSIMLDPTYSKAYSRLGHAYYGQGKYSEALNKGFLKALELDPHNSLIKENIQAATQKLIERTQQGGDQNAGSSGSQGSRPRSRSGCPFASFPPDAPIPPEMAHIFRNMASPAPHGAQAHDSVPGDPHVHVSGDHGVRVDANVMVGLADQAPEQLSEVLRSVMGMFSQNGSHNIPQGREQT